MNNALACWLLPIHVIAPNCLDVPRSPDVGHVMELKEGP